MSICTIDRARCKECAFLDSLIEECFEFRICRNPDSEHFQHVITPGHPVCDQVLFHACVRDLHESAKCPE